MGRQQGQPQGAPVTALPVVFLDLETTGLDHVRCQPLEIAMIKVDGQLNPLDGFHAIVNPPHPIDFANLDPHVVNMHTQNGLWRDVNEHGRPLADVERDALKWLGGPVSRWDVGKGEQPGPVQPRSITLAGDSVHFDLAFLRSWFPDLVTLFHHRLFDVSAFRVAREYVGLESCPILGPELHRACPDVECSIMKARWHLGKLGA